MLTVYVVSHTHWDREWYHPAGRFRQRLVALVDELLDDPPADGTSFLLDGQTVVLEDYLDVRPERASELATALRAGRLEAGPWFVLADELIPSGEGLVRNLLAGRRSLRALRAEAPPVLYCPDSFGHPAALPVLAHGFDKSLVILWRGFGGARTAESDTFWWSAPDGDRVLLYHLARSGYELGANLPADPDAARERWAHVRAELASRAGTGVALLLNGADHHARQRQLGDALNVLREIAAPDEIKSTGLTDFARELERRAARSDVPEVRGEQRDSYGYTWTLQGTLASRAPQKRRYVRRERDLIRDVEPWAALASYYGGDSRRHLTQAAWRPLLLCQPHDTLCGCSIDQVARAMDGRLESVAAQASGIREDALHEWIGHDRDAARAQRDAWRPMLVVRNRAARARSGVAIVELTTWVADMPVGPGSQNVALPQKPSTRAGKPAGAGPVQLCEKWTDWERIEAPRAYPDNDVVERALAAVWIDDVPAYGVASFPLTSSRSRRALKVEPVRVKDGTMTNGRVTVRFGKDGAVTFEQDGRSIRDLLEWESRVDVGDLYTPAIREAKLEPRFLGARVIYRGPLRGAVLQRWSLRAGAERVDIRVRFLLDAGANWLRLFVTGDNKARDHRLRLRIRTDVEGALTVADAAFGPVERQPVSVAAEVERMERPVQTAPLHRYVSLFSRQSGATLFADGLTEYETESGDFYVTLLRAVGELSRGDLPERPGHAGWPARTPAAQCRGPFEAELSLMLHRPRNAAVVDEIEHAADDILFPLVGETLRSALRVPQPLHGVALEGIGLGLSAVKESDSGEGLVLRCVNLLDQECAGAWRLGRTVNEAHLARLDETPVTPLTARDDTIPFLAPPRGVVTLLVR